MSSHNASEFVNAPEVALPRATPIAPDETNQYNYTTHNLSLKNLNKNLEYHSTMLLYIMVKFKRFNAFLKCCSCMTN